MHILWFFALAYLLRDKTFLTDRIPGEWLKYPYVEQKILNKNLYEIFRAARPKADKVFIETPEGRSIRYGDIDELTGKIANILVLDGVEPGDRVMVQVDKSPEAILLYLACLRAGAVFLPLNSAYTEGELDYFLRDAEPRILVCSPETADSLGAIAAAAGVQQVETLGADGKGSLTEKADTAPGGFSCVPRSNDDLAAIL